MSDNQFLDYIHVRSYVDKYNTGKLTLKELMMRTGLRSIGELFHGYSYDLSDDQTEEDFRRMTDSDHERLEFERLAYEIYSDILHENPGYLDQIVERLRQKKEDSRIRFGSH